MKSKKLTKLEDQLRVAKTEVQDLQSEFERDREDMLETIRKQEQQLKLATSIIERTRTLIRPSCNYYNIEKIRAEAVWDDDNEVWLLPKVRDTDQKLPGVRIDALTLRCASSYGST